MNRVVGSTFNRESNLYVTNFSRIMAGVCMVMATLIISASHAKAATSFSDMASNQKKSKASSVVGGDRASLDLLIKGDPSSAVSYLYTMGVRRVVNGNNKEGAQIFDHIISNYDSLHAPSYYQLSRLVNDKSRSMSMAQKSYLIDTSNLEYLRQYASTSYYAGQLDQAAGLYEKLRLEEGSRAENYVALAMIAQRRLDVAKVVEIVDNYTNNWGFQPQLMQLKFESLAQANKLDEAAEVISLAVEKLPEFPEFRLERARIYMALGKDSLALDDFKTVLAQDSTDVRVWVEMSEYYRLKGDIDKYIEVLARVFDADELTPESKAAYFDETFFNPALYPQYMMQIERLGLSLYSKYKGKSKAVEDVYVKLMMFIGRLDNAEHALFDMNSRNMAQPSDFDALLQIYMYQKQWDKAAKLAEQSLKRFPDHEQMQLVAPLVMYEKQEDRVNIIKALDKAYKQASVDSVRSQILTLKGDLYNEIKQIDRAEKSYIKALKLTPKDAATLNNYAYLLAVAGRDLPKALDMSIQANELEPSNPTYLDTQAWVLYMMEDYSQARDIMRRALALEAGKASKDLYMHYGDILFKLGDYLMAKNYWRKALEAGADVESIEHRILQLEEVGK